MSVRALCGSLFGILLFAATASQAATISFGETLINTINTDLNGTFSVDLLMDFTEDATLGGTVDILFNPDRLSFHSFHFNDAFLPPEQDDPFVIRRIGPEPEPPLPGKLVGLKFGHLFGLVGPGVIGTLTFQAINAGSSLLTFDTVEPFRSINTDDIQSVDFGSAIVNVSAVPVPAAAWLFGSSLIALAGVVKKRKALKHASRR